MKAREVKYGLYFLALVPPEPVFTRVQDLKIEVAGNFGSSAALKSPPHITLHMPFRYPLKKEPMVMEILSAISLPDPLAISQNGFGSFAPKVIFITVVENVLLRALQQQVTQVMRTKLNVLNTNYKDQVFHPHMTIAFRDLKKAAFQSAWKFYEHQELELDWQTHSFYLMKHNGTSWDRYKEFNFVADHLTGRK